MDDDLDCTPGFPDDGWLTPLHTPEPTPAPVPDVNVSMGDLAEVAVASAGTFFLFRALKRRRDRPHQPGRADAPATTQPEREPTPVTTAAAADDAPAAPSVDAAAAGRQDDRAVLVDFCVSLEDVLPQPALREKAHRALAKVGVQRVAPVGEPFDPDRHCAVGSVPTDDPERHDRIASVERFGFVDGDRELRIPDVIVWHYDAAYDGGIS